MPDASPAIVVVASGKLVTIVSCPTCGAAVIAGDAYQRHTRWHEGLRAAMTTACDCWREWRDRAAIEEEPGLWLRFAVAMDLLCDQVPPPSVQPSGGGGRMGTG
jgi:hypothetical protein